MAKQNDLSRAQYYEIYHKLDGQLSEIKRQLRQKSGYPYDLDELSDHLQAAVIGEFKDDRKQLLGTPTYFTLEAVSEHNTKNCFQNSNGIKYWRDDDLDTWTPQERKAHEGGIYQWQPLNFHADSREMAASVLGIDLEAEEVSNKELQKQLITGGHCVEMKQIEREIERIEAGEETSLIKDGKITFVFIQNYDGSVSVVDVYWYLGYSEWREDIHRFAFDHRWYPSCRVVSRYLRS